MIEAINTVRQLSRSSFEKKRIRKLLFINSLPPYCMGPQPLVLYVYVFPARIVAVAAVQMLVVAAVVRQNRPLYLQKIQNRRICDNQMLVRD